MRNKGVWVALSLLLVLGLLMSCSSPAPTPTQSPKPAATPTPTPASTPSPTPKSTATATAAPIVLKFATHTTETGPFGETIIAYLSEVEKRTGGRIKFERYFNETLAKTTELLAFTGKGLADMSVFSPSWTPSYMPLGQVGLLPGIIQGNIWPYAMAYRDTVNEVPALSQEIARNNVKYMVDIMVTGYGIATKGKPVATVADFKGLKLRSAGQQTVLLKAVEGVPVTMAGTDVYTAVERGTIEGTLFTPSAVGGYKLYEVAKYFSYGFPLGGATNYMAININSWNKLPPDLQKIMEQLNGDFAAIHQRIYQQQGDGKGFDAMKKAGMTIVEPTAQENAKLMEIIRSSVWDPWIQNMAKQGLPGQQLIDTWVKLSEKYKPLTPKQ